MVERYPHRTRTVVADDRPAGTHEAAAGCDDRPSPSTMEAQPAAPVNHIRRRFAWLRLALGSAWLIDGLLQSQPGVFASFLGLVQKAAQDQPAPLHTAIAWVAGRLAHAPTVANGTLASLEVLIGLVLLMGVRSREALIASMALAVPIWICGLGMGQLFSGTATDIAAAPLYFLRALAVYLGQGWRELDATAAFRRWVDVHAA